MVKFIKTSLIICPCSSLIALEKKYRNKILKSFLIWLTGQYLKKLYKAQFYMN